MIDDPPFVRILEALKAQLGALDYETDAGVQNVTVRHARNRRPNLGERPCISLVFVNDDEQEAELQRSTNETVRSMDLEMILDIDLPTENSDLDPTGWGIAGKVLAVAMRDLQRDDSPILQLVDYVTPGSIEPDDKSTSDDGRLVRAVNVLYRVRTDDANVLLAAGENG